MFIVASDAESVDDHVNATSSTSSLSTTSGSDVTAQRKRQPPQSRVKANQAQTPAKPQSPQRNLDKKPIRSNAAVTSPRDNRSRSRGSGSQTKLTSSPSNAKDAKPHRSVITFANPRNKLAPVEQVDGGAGDARAPVKTASNDVIERRNGETNNNNNSVKMVNGFSSNDDVAVVSHSNGVTNDAHSNDVSNAHSNGELTSQKTDTALPQRAPRAPRASHAKLASKNDVIKSDTLTSVDETRVVNGDVTSHD